MCEASEAIEKVTKTIMETSVQLAAFREVFEYWESLFQMLKSLDWKPCRCRICGRRYATPAEVRACASRHSHRAFERGVGGAMPAKRTGLRIAPRNREATWRGTEMRRCADVAEVNADGTTGEALRRCPFCGARAVKWRASWGTTIECALYDARNHRVMVFAATEREAVEAWNGNTGGGDDRCGY